MTRTEQGMDIRRRLANLLRADDPDLRVLTRERLAELREIAKSRRYTGRAWRDGEDYPIAESAFIWLQVGEDVGDGVMVCNLVVSQTEFTGPRPTGTSIRRHTLHVHRDELRTLKRASARQTRHAYFVLQASIPLNRSEVEPW